MSHDPCQVVFDALEARDCEPRGPEWKFRSRCPAHESDSPSLLVSEGCDKRVVLHCFVGCATADVIRALGLAWGDLFPDGHRHAPMGRRPRVEVEALIVTIERVLAGAGIHWHYTAAPDLIVADTCPACGQPNLWIHDSGRRLQASCWGAGCDSEHILAALTRRVQDGAPVTSAALARLTSGGDAPPKSRARVAWETAYGRLTAAGFAPADAARYASEHTGGTL